MAAHLIHSFRVFPVSLVTADTRSPASTSEVLSAENRLQRSGSRQASARESSAVASDNCAAASSKRISGWLFQTARDCASSRIPFCHFGGKWHPRSASAFDTLV